MQRVKSANYQLHNIKIIRQNINFNTCKLINQSLYLTIVSYNL